jgi:hypothetical protein
MRIRSVFFVAAALGATACGGGGAGKIMADTTILPYQAPDADELAGIDPDAEPTTTETPAPAPTPAQNPQK